MVKYGYSVHFFASYSLFMCSACKVWISTLSNFFITIDWLAAYTLHRAAKTKLVKTWNRPLPTPPVKYPSCWGGGGEGGVLQANIIAVFTWGPGGFEFFKMELKIARTLLSWGHLCIFWILLFLRKTLNLSLFPAHLFYMTLSAAFLLIYLFCIFSVFLGPLLSFHWTLLLHDP